MKAAPLTFLAPALLLGACATGPLTLDDDLVIPGQRIGEVQIGMPLSTLLAVKGTPIKTTPISGSDATSYTFAEGLTVGAQDEVYWIIAEDARYHTGNGVRPGADQIFARASFGKPHCVATKGDQTIYDYGNFYFRVDNDSGKVKQVAVVRAKKACDG